MILKDLPQDSRPREKLLARGPGALSNAELLALLLRTGIPGKNVLQMGQELLDTFGGVAGLLHATAADLQRIKGLGGAKRSQLVAVLELARRALAENLSQKTLFDTPQAVRDYLQLQLGSRPHEVFAMLFLDSQNRLIVLEELFRGTLDGASVHPREVVRASLKHNAAAVILAHNHPSGIAEPSAADRNITRQLRDALQLVGVRVLDHLVVGAGEPTSMAARGLI